MSGYAWLGVVISALSSTFALASWAVMAVPYMDNAPYLVELKRHSGAALKIGLAMFAGFFVIYYLGALYLDQDTSGPLLALVVLLIAMPISMLLGTETWERYNPKGMNRTPGPQAVAIATGIGLAELSAFMLAMVVLL